MPERIIRWGILSTAAINGALVPGLQAAAGNELAGVASRVPDKAEQAAAEWGCRPYSSYDELLADSSIDVVYNPLPNHLHAEWTIRALEAGKHVLCEKPIALSIEEVDAIATASARSGRLVLEAFMYRHLPRWRRACQLVAEGAIGDPRLVKVFFAFLVPDEPGNIRFEAETGGGIIWDMGCYAANMARGMFGAEPYEVFCYGDARPGQPTETSVTGVMRFPEGRVAPFSVSFDWRNPHSQVEVVGTEGWLELAGTGFRREPYTKLVRHHGGEIYVDGVVPVEEVFELADPYTLEVEALGRAITGEQPLEYTLDDARANTAVCLAMHRSLELGAPAPVRTWPR
ncbi:MAG TPA: Gfo/Idh/MocA family oxidoreductase [Acidimicrobiales bacterium]|nr:Gfo/Idh/MocA family oxidoreductase [Acidimicrobiales bacterium]